MSFPETQDRGEFLANPHAVHPSRPPSISCSTASSTPPDPETKSPNDEDDKRLLDGWPFWRLWLIEFLLGACSLCSFIIIVVILQKYDGEALPNLPMKLTLNTFLAFFTTFAKSALFIPICEALSQWKWNVFVPARDGEAPGRPLSDFELLNSASRGTWGSWKLLLRFKWRHFVSLGAVLSVLGIFISPITQLMIHYPTRQARADNETAAIKLAHNLSWAHLNKDQFLEEAMQGVYIEDPGRQTDYLVAKCTTTNCTFELYSSLSICSRVVSISEHLSVEEIQNSTDAQWTIGTGLLQHLPPGSNGTITAWNASLPNGLSLVTPQPAAITLTPWTMLREDSVRLADSPDIAMSYIGSVYLVYTNEVFLDAWHPNRTTDPHRPWPFEAMEVLFYLCVNTYQTSYSSGESRTTVVKSTSEPVGPSINQPLFNVTCSLVSGFSDCSANRDDSQNNPTYFDLWDNTTAAAGDDYHNETFMLDVLVTDRITEIIVYLCQFFFSEDYESFVDDDWGMLFSGSEQVSQLLYGRFANMSNPNLASGDLDKLRVLQFKAIEFFADNLARGFSNGLRAAAAEVLHGTAWVDQVFVSIQWGWVAFLASQIALAFLFLAVTIWYTSKHRMPVYKSSELATLLAPTTDLLETGRNSHAGGSGDLVAAERWAESTFVRLDEGGRLVLARLEEASAASPVPSGGDDVAIGLEQGPEPCLHPRAPAVGQSQITTLVRDETRRHTAS